MRLIPGATFWMGCDGHYPEEAPARRVAVDGFWIDETPVSNRQFGEFVAATGHVTLAERSPDLALYPTADPAMRRPGSALFVQPDGPVRLDDPSRWWQFRFGVDWRHPWGPDSSVALIADHPVVHVAYADAQAYADWQGKSLPTEAEWEFAARGGLDRQPYAWGDELEPAGTRMANYWHGIFPFQNLMPGGHERTSPVRSYPANGYGLYDMIGNVWEWTSDSYAAGARRPPTVPCCVARSPRGDSHAVSGAAHRSDLVFGRKVIKGGSHLCASNYCQRYRPAARAAQTVDTSTSHIGLRCVVRSGDCRAAP